MKFLLPLLCAFVISSPAMAFSSVFSKKVLEKGKYKIDCMADDHYLKTTIEGSIEIGKVKGNYDGEMTDVSAEANGRLRVEIKDQYSSDKKEDYSGRYVASFDDVDDHAKHEITLENPALKINVVLWENKTEAYVYYKGREIKTGSCSLR